jgi:hypothetical protein
MIRAADPKTRPQVVELLDSAHDLGLKVLRMWAFNDGPVQYNTLQRYPGIQSHCPHFCKSYSLSLFIAWISFLRIKERQAKVAKTLVN